MDKVIEQGIHFAHNAIKITTGRLSTNVKDGNPDHYRPVGYLISEQKAQEDEATGRLKESSELRQQESLELSQRLRNRPHSSRN